MMLLHRSVIRFVLGIISLAMCIGLIKSLYSQLWKDDAVKLRNIRYAQELERNASLKSRLKEATGSAFIEKQAREKLGLVKEGDTVILIDSSNVTNSNNQIQYRGPKTNWEAWVRLFF